MEKGRAGLPDGVQVQAFAAKPDDLSSVLNLSAGRRELAKVLLSYIHV